MAEFPRPSERWHRWLARDCDYLVASVLGVLAIVLAFRQVQSNGLSFEQVLTLGMAALPIGCLLMRPNVATMIGLAIVGCPCFCSGSVYCDISNNAASPLLHPIVNYLIFVPGYGVLRALHLGFSKP